MIAAEGDTTADGERVLGEWWSQDDECPADERAYYDEHATDRLLPSDGDTVRTMDQWTAELCAEENAEDGSRTKGSTASESYGRTAAVASADDDEDKDAVDHHDSDTESFYNIWGGDDEWLYGNRLRNVVRNLHREFNRKYDREAREEKLFRLLKSEAKYAAKKNKIDDMEKERMKLTKDMFEAGDAYQRLKSQQDIKSKKRKKSSLNQNRRYKAIQNDEESTLKRENTPLIDEQNNSVIIWSIDDNIFPKLRLESPEEVYCVEFNPRNGNTVVGGLINGQICIWDISGKLEDVNSNDSSMTKKEKKHHKHLWMHMKWSLDVNFKTRIRPAALSAILESHESMVTAIQWIHPMNEITPLGKLVTVQEGHFSEQFFSSSLDGTVKLWDLHSTPLPKSKHQSTVKPRFGHPENLNKYKSPLSIYNNRLKPSYTIIIKEQENAMNNPITAMSFEIPLMRFKYTSNQPMVIGKRQFEYVPSVPNDLNRFLVVGSFMGQIGVVTWDGYDTYQKGQNKDGIKEVCKTIWWGLAHDGPINCIKRNVFYPDIHLVCGGHVVSVWSLNYENGPIWFKRFDDCTNSGLWSTVHPAEFRVSFNNIGVLQFWDFMKYTHRPYYTFDFFLSDGLIASLSAPPPCVRVVERFECADGIHEVLDSGKNELIGFSDSTGAIMMIAVDSPPLGPSEVDAVRQAFQDEVDRRRELDAWNGRYKETYGAAGENNVDDFDYGHAAAAGSEPPPTTTASKAEPAAALTAEQIKRKICDETFKWYFNRRGPQTRLGKMKEAYLEREKQYMVESMMKKKNVSQKHLEEYCNVQAEVKTKYNEAELQKIRIEADETYRDIVNKLLAAERMEEYVFDVDSKRSTESDEIKNTFEKIHQLMVTDLEDETEKLNDYIKNNPYKVEQENWAQVIELAEREVRDRLNDPTLLKSPALRVMRRKLAKKYIEGGYKIKEWKSRGDQHACDKYKIRETRLNKLKTMYGKSYNPYWDKGLRPQKIKDAVHLRVTEEGDEQSYGSNYFEGESGEGEGCYGEYLSLVESGSMMSNYQEESGREPSVDSDGKSMSTMTENRWEAESYEDEQTSSVKGGMYKNQQVYNEYDEDQELETLDEQSQVE